MTKTDKKKTFVSYRGQLLELARLYGVVEIKSYARSHKKLTTSQLELLLIKNNIKIPVNRSSAKIIEKWEIREKTITNNSLSPELSIKLLTFRRREKDFLLRRDAKYLTKLDKDISSFEDILNPEVLLSPNLLL